MTYLFLSISFNFWLIQFEAFYSYLFWASFFSIDLKHEKWKNGFYVDILELSLADAKFGQAEAGPRDNVGQRPSSVFRRPTALESRVVDPVTVHDTYKLQLYMGRSRVPY